MKILASVISVIGLASVNANLSVNNHVPMENTIGDAAMWVLGSDGVSIFSADGMDTIKVMEKENVCHNVSSYRGEGYSVDCSFYDAKSDGEKYVWASVSRGASVIDVFDINTGDVVASIPTCQTPRDLNFHQGRGEMWVRCMAPDPENFTLPGHIQSFSTNNLASPSRSIKLVDDVDFSAYGYAEFSSDLGDTGYSTVYGKPYLYQIDLNKGLKVAEFEIENAYGLYESTFSAKNDHIYAITHVCCTCGFEGADYPDDCGRYGTDGVNITTGPFAGTYNTTGLCGSRCMGTPADTVGIIEFDTTANKVVGNHFSKAGGSAVPASTPNGEYVVLMDREDEDNFLRVLKPGMNGEASTTAFDLDMGLTGRIADFAFINDKILVVASEETNDAIFINLETMVKFSVRFSENEESTGNRRGRQIEWAEGTPYVWVSGRDAEPEEVYVLEMTDDMSNAVLHHTISGIDPRKMLFVQNYVNMHEQSLLDQAAVTASEIATQAAELAVKEAMANLMSSSTNAEVPEATGTTGTVSSASVVGDVDGAMGGDDDSSNGLSLAALIVGLFALVIGVVNLLPKAQPVESKTAQYLQAPGAKAPGANFDDDASNAESAV